MCISIPNYGIKASWKWHPFFSNSAWLLRLQWIYIILYWLLNLIFLLSCSPDSITNFCIYKKIMNYAPSRKCGSGIPSARSVRWDTSSCLPATHAIVTVTVPLTEISLPNNQPIFSPQACAAPPGQEGADGDGEGQICSTASLLLPPHLSIHPAGPSVVVFQWGWGQLGSGWASSQVLGVPWPLSVPLKSEQQSIPVSQTAPLCSSHVTIEGVCF